jgi:hypothetical protein
MALDADNGAFSGSCDDYVAGKMIVLSDRVSGVGNRPKQEAITPADLLLCVTRFKQGINNLCGVTKGMFIVDAVFRLHAAGSSERNQEYEQRSSHSHNLLPLAWWATAMPGQSAAGSSQQREIHIAKRCYTTTLRVLPRLRPGVWLVEMNGNST